VTWVDVVLGALKKARHAGSASASGEPVIESA
jgi:hypothetical protein